MHILDITEEFTSLSSIMNRGLFVLFYESDLYLSFLNCPSLFLFIYPNHSFPQGALQST